MSSYLLIEIALLELIHWTQVNIHVHIHIVARDDTQLVGHG